MAEMGQPSGERGAVIKHEFLFPLPLGDGFPESLIFLPIGEDLFLQFGKTLFGINAFVHNSSVFIERICHIWGKLKTLR
jgi:hypothetical protein